MNSSEKLLRDDLEGKGWAVTKKGMPDFVCFKGEEVVLIEVKQKRSHRLKTEQYHLMTALARLGIRCFRWDPEVGFQQITPMVHDISKHPKPTDEIAGPPLIPAK